MINNSGALNSSVCRISRVFHGLLVAVLFSAASHSACGSCGDYLVERVPLPASSHDSIDENFPSVLLAETITSGSPCTGPGCKQAPKSPTEHQLADFQRASFRDLNVLRNLESAADNGVEYRESASNISVMSPDRDRLDRPPERP